MNKEDILKILEGAKDKNGDVPMRLVRQAFEKLPEPCTDTISRQAAIDAADKIIERDTSGNNAVVNAMIAWSEYIKTLPSAQPEPKWIPCSERLPDSPKQVLVYARSVHYALAKYDEMREADGSYKKQWVTFDAWKPFYTIKEVIAWMPLPEPYAERREE